MNNQIKRVAFVVTFGAIFALLATDASAFGRSKKSGYRGWTQNSSETSNGGGSVVNNENPGDRVPSGDSNPVPEPASLVLLGSALAGLGGYRGLRKRMSRKS